MSSHFDQFDVANCMIDKRCVDAQNDELSFDEGDLLYILDMSNADWWKAKCGDATGLIPSNYGTV